MERDTRLHISKPQNCPEIEWTPLRVVVSSPSVKVFKHSMEDHFTVILQTRLKHRAEKVWSLKYLSVVKLEQDWLSDTNGINGALKIKTKQALLFNNSPIMPLSSSLRKRGILECEKTIFIFSSLLHVIEDIFTFSNVV